MNPRDVMIRQLTQKNCDVLTCPEWVAQGVDVCLVHADGALRPNDLEVAAAGRQAAVEAELWLALQANNPNQI